MVTVLSAPHPYFHLVPFSFYRKTFFSISCSVELLVMNFSACVCLKKCFILPSFLKTILEVFFCEYSHVAPLFFLVLLLKRNRLSSLSLLLSFSSGCFWDFLFITGFQQFHHDVPGCRFLHVSCLWASLSFCRFSCTSCFPMSENSCFNYFVHFLFV